MFDWLSFLGGVALASVGAYFSGFLQEAGKDSYSLIKRKVNPPAVGPERVARDFVPVAYAPGDCAWVAEAKVFDKEAQGWTRYPGPRTGGPAHRSEPNGNAMLTEYLLVKPNANRRS